MIVRSINFPCNFIFLLSSCLKIGRHTKSHVIHKTKQCPQLSKIECYACILCNMVTFKFVDTIRRTKRIIKFRLSNAVSVAATQHSLYLDSGSYKSIVYRNAIQVILYNHFSGSNVNGYFLFASFKVIHNLRKQFR